MKQAVRRKHHYIYKITRTDSNRYYIGMHSTDDLDDGYFGSGKLLAASIRKHGKEKHHKEILEHLPSREALKLREKELVNTELVNDRLCMNLVPGGGGGSEVGRLGAEALKRKRQDLEFEAKHLQKMCEVGKEFSNRVQSDEDFRAMLSEANGLAAKKKRAKREADLEYDRTMYEKVSALHKGRKDSPEARANKSAAQKKLGIEHPELKIASASKARAALAAKSPEELVDIKRRMSEGAKQLAAELANDSDRWQEIVEKKRQTRIQNGTNVMSAEARANISAKNTGKKRSPDVIARAKLRTGELTTSFSTVWMNLNGLRRRVKKCDTLQFEQQGFSYGR